MLGFFVKAGTFYISWQIIYDLFLLPNGQPDEFLSLSVATLAKSVLSLSGWDINCSGRVIVIEGYRGVEVLNGCNALNLMALYSGFIIAFKGPLKSKIQYLISFNSFIFL